jgi:NAD+ synthase
MNNTKPLANEIVAWLKDYAVKNNRRTLVVGVSGGVDSALVSTLCAMTDLPTICVTLPCQSKNDGLTNADKHINWLRSKNTNVSSFDFDLTKAFESFKKSFSGLFDSPLGWANTKSRLRMIALYQIATPAYGLVVGTGNKAEDFGVMFFTKYGDGGVDISPIADLMKSEVRQMCRDLGILPELCEAVPTDGLWDDTRTDETQLGATYDELEWAMKTMELGTCEYEGPHFTDRQLEILKIYNKWHKAGAHKLAPIPTFKRKA